MKNRISGHISKIISHLQSHGFETYLVGGAVRDILCGLIPKDHDISTKATPEQIRNIFGGRDVKIIGKRFRLAHYHHGREIIEISTFRKAPEENQKVEPKLKHDHGRQPHLHFADNEFGNAEEDAWRRDFTVNSIFYDPVADRIVDFTGMGVDDLNRRIIRCIGDPALRFEEDPVRILRALKLCAQYGFTFDGPTEKAMMDRLHLIKNSSVSRLSLELHKILHRHHSDKIFRVFHEYGFLKYFLPYLDSHWGSAESDLMLEMLAMRNQRLYEGIYRDSISLSLAVTAFPFVEKKLRSESATDHALWNYFPGIESEVRKIVQQITFPNFFSRRIIASAVTAIMLQPALLKMKNRNKISRNRRFPNSRELMTVLNGSRWKDEELEKFWA